MSKLGLVCLWLVLFALIAEFYLAAKLGMRRGEVSDALRVAIAESEKAMADHAKAKSEAVESRQALANVRLGWGQEWAFPGGNPAPVQAAPGGKLLVNGLGASHGLKRVDLKDKDNAALKNETGNPMIAPPVVHVFKGDGAGGSIYIGEFVAELNELTETSCVLYPRWNVSPEDFQEWDFSNGARLRSEIPAGGRSAVENLHQAILRTREQIVQTSLRIEEQQGLNAAAEAALQARRNELLGDPAAPVNADHPEYRDGLVQALEDLEEERNDVQIAVDQLRRLIKTATESRTELVDTLKQIVSRSMKSGTQLSKRQQ